MSACHSGKAGLSLLASCIATIPGVSRAAEIDRGRPLEEVVVTAPYGVGIDPSLVPANVQRATAEEIERSQSLDLTDFLNRGFASVNINHAQNNPLQPDFNFRGFTASPLLGLPQGLAVYQNGVRINEPFGDTINWDLMPFSAIDSVQLMAGTQPVFGLNTLGGAVSLRMKNGFNHEGTQAKVYGGSFSRRAGVIQSGGNNGRWGYYGNIDYFEEDGWRDYSKSDALRVFTALSGRGDDWTLDLSGAYGETELRGNGASPVELLAIDREQVFTHPDLTENTQAQVILEGSRKLSDGLRFAGNVFYRDIDTDTFNGDGTIFEECDIEGEEFLVEDEFIDVNQDGECSSADDERIEPVLDLNGAPIEAELGDAELDAINNIGHRRQESYGASAQLGLRSTVLGGANDLMLGVAYSEGRASFDSMVEVARLLENRATSRTSIFAEEFITDVRSEVTSASVYFADTLSVSERVAVTLSGRYDNTRIQLSDRTGESPELDGRHEFQRFNPAGGITFQPTTDLTLYVSYGESARAPSPVELACASEDAPCNLPNAFLADPPLQQVVAKSWEAGARGTLGNDLRWHLGGFRTVNHDDILFQTTGGAQANVGFFDNVGDTRRTGLEVSISQRRSRLHWYLEYSLIKTTFEDSFIINSPNHPLLDEQGAAGSVGEGKLRVGSGATIPGIPEHQGNAGLDFMFSDRFGVGADVVVRSGVYLRGDEANLLEKTDSYTILNLRGEYRIGDHVTLFARIENVFDEEYETFGLLGEPDEVFAGFGDPRFFGAGPPFGVWMGVKLRL